MTPEKFFDYLEGKLPPAEKERLERALISDPELQREFVAARQIHQSIQRPAGETAATARAGSRGRQLAAAFAVLVAMNVAFGLYFVFRSGGPSAEVEKARTEKLRQELQSSLEKSADAVFPPPTVGPKPVPLTVPRAQQEEAARAIIDAATKAGGSATKGLPNESGFPVLVLIPGSAEPAFRETLARLSATPLPPAPAAPRSPEEAIHLEVVLSSPP